MTVPRYAAVVAQAPRPMGARVEGEGRLTVAPSAVRRGATRRGCPRLIPVRARARTSPRNGEQLWGKLSRSLL